MNYRYATVLAEKSLSAAGTETIDIDVQDPISRLEIAWKPTLADVSMLAALAAGISKIELVDGSEVLHSLNGRANQALCIYDRKVETLNDGCLYNGGESHATMGIDFGRYLYDPELAFDPKQFRNPQLKITHDRAVIGASTSTHKLEVFAHLFDEKVISPVGFLMAKEHYTYTPTANNAYEYIDLPTDRPIRQLLLRGYQSGQDPKLVADHLKLSEDNDKRIPFDADLVYYIKRMKGVWGKVIEALNEYVDPSGNYDKYMTPTDDHTMWVATGITTTYSMGLDQYIRGGYVRRYCSGSTTAAPGIVIGYLPHHCIQIPFGIQSDLNDWYDVTKVGSLKARVQSAEQYSGAEISIILQQLRRY